LILDIAASLLTTGFTRPVMQRSMSFLALPNLVQLLLSYQIVAAASSSLGVQVLV